MSKIKAVLLFLFLLSCLSQASVLLEKAMIPDSKERIEPGDTSTKTLLSSLIARKIAQLISELESKQYELQKKLFSNAFVLSLTSEREKVRPDISATSETTLIKIQENFDDELSEISASPESTPELLPETKLFNLFNIVVVLFWTLLFFIMLSLIVYNICCKRYPTRTISTTYSS